MRLVAIAIAATCIVAVTVVGCFSPRFNNGHLRCDNVAPRCPDGYECSPVDNNCWKPGTGPTGLDGGTDDGGTDMAQPPSLTYPPAAIWTSCGGGAATASSGNEVNISLCPSIAGGTSVSPSGSIVTFGFFSSDIY